MKFGIDIPNGWKMSLVDIKDPVEAYEAMTTFVTTGEELGYDSAGVVDHFHTVPTPTPHCLTKNLSFSTFEKLFPSVLFLCAQ